MSTWGRICRGLMVLGAVSSCWGLWIMRDTDALAEGISIFLIAIGVTAVGSCISLTLESPQHGDGLWYVIRRAAPHLIIPLVFGLAIYPATAQHGESLDPSWFGVVPTIVLLGGLLVILLVLITWVMVLMPLAVLVFRLVPALHGDRGSQAQVLFALLFLDVVGFAVSARVATGGGPREGGFLHALLISTSTGGWLLRFTVLVAVIVMVSMTRFARAERSEQPHGDGEPVA